MMPLPLSSLSSRISWLDVRHRIDESTDRPSNLLPAPRRRGASNRRSLIKRASPMNYYTYAIREGTGEGEGEGEEEGQEGQEEEETAPA